MNCLFHVCTRGIIRNIRKSLRRDTNVSMKLFLQDYVFVWNLVLLNKYPNHDSEFAIYQAVYEKEDSISYSFLLAT